MHENEYRESLHENENQYENDLHENQHENDLHENPTPEADSRPYTARHSTPQHTPSTPPSPATRGTRATHGTTLVAASTPPSAACEAAPATPPSVKRVYPSTPNDEATDPARRVPFADAFAPTHANDPFRSLR